MPRKAVILVLCGLVFFFALHAKTACYGSTAQAKITPSTSAKLWVSGQKMEVRPVANGGLPLFGLLLLCLFGLESGREPGIQLALVTPTPSNLRLRYLHRFLRPPPVQS